MLPDKIKNARTTRRRAAKKAASKNVADAHPTAQNDIKYCDAKQTVTDLNNQLDGRERARAHRDLMRPLLPRRSLFCSSRASSGGADDRQAAAAIRVVRMDGSPARARDLFRRYMLLVFAAYALFRSSVRSVR